MSDPSSAPAALGVGPPVEVLTHRLLETPSDFLAAPVVAGRGLVDVAAVVSDLLVDLGLGPLDPSTAELLRPASETPDPRNRLWCVLVAAWLLHAPELHADPLGRPLDRERVVGFLVLDVARLAEVVAAPTLVADPDRREELARRALRALGLVPVGETEAQAADRLGALDSVERARVLAETREAELRAAEVREALHSKRAAEAAAKASRE